MRVFNLAEELEKERKKNKELEKQLNCKKEYTKYLPEDVEFIILTKPDYDRQQEELQDKVFELEKEINRLTAESTHYESKYYNEAKKVDSAINYCEENCYTYAGIDEEGIDKLLDILKGSDDND